MMTAARRAFPTVAVLGFLSACSGGEAAGSGGGGGGSGGIGGTGGGISPLDTSNISFVDNLLVKVEDGEWMLGEGLVATLQLFVGELDADSVLRHPDLLNYEGTGIIRMAYEYLEDGPDAEAKAEINRLLGLLVFSNEELEAMAGLDLLAPAPPDEFGPSGEKGAVEDCVKFFNPPYKTPAGVGKCLEHLTSSALDDFYPGDYRIFYPAPSFPAAGWTEQHYNRALAAMEKTVPVLKGLGKLPKVNLVFSVRDDPASGAAAAVNVGGKDCKPPVCGSCGVVLYMNMQTLTEGEDFKQYIAHELGHCFHAETFPVQTAVGYATTKWWEEAHADHLSNVVYPDNNLEWGDYPRRRSMLELFAVRELRTILFNRAYENFIFFQYLANRLGDGGVLKLIETLRTADQATALAAYPGIDGLYHDFAKAMTDREVIDTSGALIPYELEDINRPTVELTGPYLIMEDVEPFGVSRYRIVVEEGKQARLAFREEGEVREAARPENRTDWGEIPTEIPGDDCNSEVIVVATATKPDGSFELEAREVEETEASCGLVGEWLVDNSSLQTNFGSYTLDYMSGEIRITFRDDGTAEVVYDNFEYHLSKDTNVSLGDMQFVRHEEFTYTTNASGVTTYEVDGNEIAFGHVFESSYLEGTEMVHQIRVHTPTSGLLDDIDEVTTRDASGWGMFSGYPTFELGSGGSVLRFVTGITVTLNRVGSGQ